MRWPAALLTHSRQLFLAFVAAELLLVMAIPFLLIQGYHTLLDSRAGTFAEEPTKSDPGWTALVESTPILGVAEVDGERLTGLALVVAATGGSNEGDGSGSVVLAPASMQVTVNDRELRLDSLEPAAAVAALADTLRIDLVESVTMDAEAWSQAFGPAAYQIDNPDPVPTDGRTLAFAVGTAVVDGSNAAVFLGRPVAGAAPESVGPRRTVLWKALIEQPPDGGHPLSDALNEAFAGRTGQVLDLPRVATAQGAKLDPGDAEALVRDIVPFPSGHRLKMRIIDRTGDAELEAIAAAVAGRGIEVLEIANAVGFDSGTTELIVPDSLTVGRTQLDQLANDLGVEPVVDYELGSADATLLVGADFALP